jgi:hypothetical protein
MVIDFTYRYCRGQLLGGSRVDRLAPFGVEVRDPEFDHQSSVDDSIPLTVDWIENDGLRSD